MVNLYCFKYINNFNINKKLIYFTLALNVLLAEAKGNPDSVIERLLRADRIILYSTNHFSEKINNVHMGLTTGLTFRINPVNFFYESAYLNIELANKLIRDGHSKEAALREYLGIQFSYIDSSLLSDLHFLIRQGNLNFKGIDCSGSRIHARDILIDSTYRYFRLHNISSNYLAAAEKFIRGIPQTPFRLSKMLWPMDDFNNLDSLYYAIFAQVESEFLLKSWASIYNFFELFKLRSNDMTIDIDDCKSLSWLEGYRDKIMYNNYKEYRTGSGIDVIWLGSSHSARRIFDRNRRGDRFRDYSNSFADFLATQNNNSHTINVLITDESLDLSQAKFFNDTIGGVSVKVYNINSSHQKDKYYFNMKVLCDKSFKTNWFKSFDYIIVTK